MQRSIGSWSILAAALAVGCATGEPAAVAGPGEDEPPVSAAADSGCVPCLTDLDCPGAVCAQFQGDIFCATECDAEDACPPGHTCRLATTYSGAQVSICEPLETPCGEEIAPPIPDGGYGFAAGKQDAAPADHCGTMVGPDVTAGCGACYSSGKTCQANGCYGGWWCDTETNGCHAPPTSCSSPGQDAGTDTGADDEPSGSVGPNGGTLSRLVFAVVGDTRPPTVEDTGGYPSSIIRAIFTNVAKADPSPPFVVATGDYIFTKGSQASAQLDLYLAARAKYPGTVFPVMGNHECTGATASNCGPNVSSGKTNYTTFVDKLLAPINQTKPYYVVNVDGSDGSWTAKFVFIAANAWDATQKSWLEKTMATPTTYTFVVRHEPSSATTAPGVSPSNTILKAHPYTLLLVGHTHTYGRSGTKQVIIGNGGAPLTGSGNYGYALIQQRADGAIQVDMIDYQSGKPDTSFRFAVKADGTSAP